MQSWPVPPPPFKVATTRFLGGYYALSSAYHHVVGCVVARTLTTLIL